jgi:hypothetical protein
MSSHRCDAKPVRQRPNRQRKRTSLGQARAGATLIDVATGSMLLAVLLIPSVHLLGKSKSSQQRLATRETLLFAADQLIESTKVALSEAATFDAAVSNPVDTVQPVASSDVPNLTSRVRIAADAAVQPAILLTVLVDVWQDHDRNGVIDTDEPRESCRTQWSAP